MKKFIIISILLSIFFSSCTNKNGKTKDILITDSISIEKSSVYEKYSIPLPIEIYRSIIKNYNFTQEYLTPLPDKNKTYTQIEDAEMLGIYSADLAYCSLLENGQTTLDYSDACGFFAKELKIQDAYNKKYIDKLKRNINNTDSLIIITNKAYNQTCNLLENYGLHNIMPFVIYSGWIESIYLTFNSMPDSLKNSDFVNKIIPEIKINSLVNYLYDVQIETSAYYYNDQLKSLIYNLLSVEHLFQEYIKDNIDYSNLIKNLNSEKTKIENSKK